MYIHLNLSYQDVGQLTNLQVDKEMLDDTVCDRLVM